MSRATTLLIFILAAFAAPPSYALTASSASYRLVNGSFSSSGGVATSANYRVTDCLASEAAAGGVSTSLSYVMHAACAAAIQAFLPADDDDHDGVSGGNEDGAPNNGDGNNDGIKDRIQPQVVSLPGVGGDGYKTLEACGDALCTNICQAGGVRALREEDLLQQSDEYEFPYGLLEFTLNCSPVDVRVLYHGLDRFTSVNRYVNFGPIPPGASPSQFYTFPGAAFGTEIIPVDDAVASVQLRLADGTLGDDTVADGIIITRGGPAVRLSVPIPAIGLSGMLATIIIIFLISLVALRRVAGQRN